MALHKIALKQPYIVEEGRAGGAVTPGMLVSFNGTEWVVHATAGGSVCPIFAQEKDLSGSVIDTAYANDEQIHLIIPQRGAEIYAWLLSGENVHAGDLLESGGSGYLREVDTDTSAGTIKVQSIVGTVLEDANGTSAAVRVKIRVW